MLFRHFSHLNQLLVVYAERTPFSALRMDFLNVSETGVSPFLSAMESVLG